MLLLPATRAAAQDLGVPTPATAPAARDAIRVSGRVLSQEDGRPLSRANVALMPQARGGRPAIARTGQSGTFEFTDVQPGRYRLRADRGGFISQYYGQRGSDLGVLLTLEPGQDLAKIDFWLPMAGGVSGAVTDENLKPVKGFEVRVMQLRFAPGGRFVATTIATERTDGQGRYSVLGLQPGFYFVHVGGNDGQAVSATSKGRFTPLYYPGVASQDEAMRIRVTPGNEAHGYDIRVHTASAYTISGEVVDHASPPTAERNYAVGIARKEGLAMRSVNPDGTFTLKDVQPGEYTLVAMVANEGNRRRRGYQTVRVTDDDVSVAVEVGGNAEVRGRARLDAEGDLYSYGLSVILRPTDERGIVASAPVEADGSFRIPNVAPGGYAFELAGRGEFYLKDARCRGESHLVEPLVLSSDELVDRCELVMARNVGSVSGTVTFGSQPVVSALVVLVPVEMERRKIPRHTVLSSTDPDGRYTARNIVPGDYFIFSLFPLEDSGYYDLDFPERNAGKLERVTIQPNASIAADLKFLTDLR